MPVQQFDYYYSDTQAKQPQTEPAFDASGDTYTVQSEKEITKFNGYIYTEKVPTGQAPTQADAVLVGTGTDSQVITETKYRPTF